MQATREERDQKGLLPNPDGHQWWIGTTKANGQPWIVAFGNGGQRLFIIPSWQLVVVVTASNYNAPDQWKLPLSVMTEIVVPALLDE